MTRKRLLHGAITVIMLVLLVLYARTVDWRAAWNAIGTASVPILVIATVTNLVTLGAKAVTWWIFLRPIGARSLGLSIRATAAGAGLNNILIANTGEAARVLFVTRAAGVRSSAVLAALALERLFDLIGYVILLVGGAFFLPMPPELARFRGAAAVALLAVFVLFALLLRPAPAASATAAVPTSAVGRARAYLGRFMSSVRDIVTVPRLLAALALSMLNWGGQLATYHLTAVAVHFPITITGSLAAMLAANVGFLVRATPGNVGVFQMVYAVTAEALGLSKDAAVAVALLLQTLQNVPTTLLGVALAPDLVLHFRERRHISDGQPLSHGARRATDPVGRAAILSTWSDSRPRQGVVDAMPLCPCCAGVSMTNTTRRFSSAPGSEPDAFGTTRRVLP
jgi:uncharacterized protein (TIRG00374 family)